MPRTFHDKFLGRDLRIPSRAELEARRNADALRAQGIDIVGLRCSCCGLKLIDLSKIKASADGAIGRECSKHCPELYPCRHTRHDGEISLEQFHGHYTAQPAFTLLQ